MKKLISILAAGLLTASMAMTAFAGSWQKNSTGWWYQNDDGSWPAACWQQINGAWYYFNAGGYMLENSMTPDGYYVGPDGVWVQNGQSSQQAADTSALGDRYHYAYSLDAAGGQLYTCEGDVAYASGTHIAVHAASEGVKRIHVPGKGRLVNALTGEALPGNESFVDVRMARGETLLLRIEAID